MDSIQDVVHLSRTLGIEYIRQLSEGNRNGWTEWAYKYLCADLRPACTASGLGAENQNDQRVKGICMKVPTQLAGTGFVIFAMTLAIAATTSPAFAQSKAQVSVINPTTSPVNISGPVTVTNSVLPVEVSNADPIPVTLITSQSPEIVQKMVSDLLDTGDHNGNCDIYTVPAGKRLIIEYVNFHVGGGADDVARIFHVTIRKDGPASGDFYVLPLPGLLNPAGTRYEISQPITMYADAGETVFGVLANPTVFNQMEFGCRIAGRLVDMS